MFYGFFISETYTFIVHISHALFSKISDKMNELNKAHTEINMSAHGIKTEAFASTRYDLYPVEFWVFSGSFLTIQLTHCLFSVVLCLGLCMCKHFLPVIIFWKAYCVRFSHTVCHHFNHHLRRRRRRRRQQQHENKNGGIMYASEMNSTSTNSTIYALLLCHNDSKFEEKKKEINLMDSLFSLRIHFHLLCIRIFSLTFCAFRRFSFFKVLLLFRCIIVFFFFQKLLYIILPGFFSYPKCMCLFDHQPILWFPCKMYSIWVQNAYYIFYRYQII